MSNWQETSINLGYRLVSIRRQTISCANDSLDYRRMYASPGLDV